MDKFSPGETERRPKYFGHDDVGLLDLLHNAVVCLKCTIVQFITGTCLSDNSTSYDRK